MDPKGTFGSSRKKKKYADEELLLDSSDDEYTFNTEESEGYRLMDVKNLSSAVSNAHVCEEGEKYTVNKKLWGKNYRMYISDLKSLLHL